MNRAQFLRLLGVGSLITATGLPSFAEVEKHIAEVDKIKQSEDPFWHIRKLMKERALPDWEYHFRVSKEPTFKEGGDRKEYNNRFSVFLLQNGNHHAEMFYDAMTPFDERHQEMMFKSLIHGVDQFNALPEEKRNSIIEMMDNIKKYGHA